MSLRAVSLTTVGLLLLGTAGCNLAYDRLTDGASRNEPITEIQISGGSGDVNVVTDGSVKGVELVREVQYRGSAPGSTYEFLGSVLNLRTSCGNMCGITYTVKLPPRGTGTGVTVRGTGTSGDIKVHGVGKVDLSLGSGDVEVTDATGPVLLRATSGDLTVNDVADDVSIDVGSGDIRGRNLQKGVQVQVTSGDVDLDLSGGGDARVHASSGDLTLRVPNNVYAVKVSTTSGDTNLDVIQGTARQLDVSTTSGDVRVTGR